MRAVLENAGLRSDVPTAWIAEGLLLYLTPEEDDRLLTTVSALSQVGTTLEGTLASYSNRGQGVIDVAAPGSRILSTLPGNSYGLLSGTSMASPHVAGVLALLKSVHPTWTPAQLLATLDAQADAQACTESPGGPACTGRTADNSYYGNGKVDANQAVRQ